MGFFIMAISKKLRFEVFKRDNFKCQYCGKTPPEITLEVDHIKPKIKKGTDDINNLVTACFDCNRGKSSHELNQIPNTIQENYDIILERENQYNEYQKLLKKVNDRINKEIYKIDDIYNLYFKNYYLSDGFRNVTVKKFIKELGLAEVENAMHVACSKMCWDENKALRYFCGICWNKIKKY